MEFHAIIFCGKGNSLSPISAVKDTGVPKALLPIANKPMIEYVLEWCDKAPFREVTVVTDVPSHSKISKVVDNYKSKRSKELANTFGLNCISSDAVSTGSMLRQYGSQFAESGSNVVILPCDFITDVPPQVFIEIYRGNSDDNLGLGICYNNTFDNVDNKVLKTNYTVFAEKDDGTTVLLDLFSKSSVNTTKFLDIRTQLLWRYPNTSVSTNLLDSFIFFASAKIFSILAERKEEVFTKSATKIKRDLARRSWKHSEKLETMGLFNLPKQSTFARCNNLSVYMEVNRLFLKQRAREVGNVPRSKDNTAATIGADSIVGADTTLGERTNVKRTVIGNNCKIGKKCRITACVVLDNVTIEDEVNLENCIIGQHAKLEKKCKLVNCNVEGSYIVGQSVVLKGETLTNISLDSLESEDALYTDSHHSLSDDDDDDDDDLGSDEYDDIGFEEEEYEDDIFAR
ncbi:unnamed protein product [Ambrosiozyma monospora]|uniref:Translation initiation factor eIF2B subunit gamma n=1 Tax=Ambrosiozyma monospora TaxID=43982 RepID=A0A9W6YQ47_AMBMO|nr:unnamed protein product [Ambrosiozyma monospora]